MDLQLQGKAALVTGGSEGIGLHIAKALAAEGCRVAVCARRREAIDEALRQIGGNASAVIGDVTDPADAARIIVETVNKLGGLDILVNNVGGAAGGTLDASSDADWRATFEMNVFSTVRMIRLAAPHLAGRDDACVVNIASISGWSPQLAFNGQYGSSKAALIYLAQVLALELAPRGIRVNTLSPGSIVWNGGAWDRVRREHPDAYAAYERDGFPAGRLGSPQEVADVAAFLASPRARWINGANIPVDGLEQPVPLRL